MRPMKLGGQGEKLSVLSLGAHSDDIGIGAGGTILELSGSGACVDIVWCVLSATGAPAKEAEAAAGAFLYGGLM